MHIFKKNFQKKCIYKLFIMSYACVRVRVYVCNVRVRVRTRVRVRDYLMRQSKTKNTPPPH